MQQTRIIVDNRERNPELLAFLNRNGVDLTFAQLPIGDYILSDRMCAERKTEKDFENSIIDTRLFEQANRLSNSFEKAVMIIENDGSERAMGRNIILGAILKLHSEFGIQVLFSSSGEETAYILNKLADKEQQREGREPRLAGQKKASSTYQWQLLILGSIPGIGPTLAKSLIRHFKTLKNVALASPEELMEVEKIGRKKADKVFEILNSEFIQNEPVS